MKKKFKSPIEQLQQLKVDLIDKKQLNKVKGGAADIWDDAVIR